MNKCHQRTKKQSTIIKPNDCPLNGKSNNKILQAISHQDISNTNDDSTSNSFNQKDKMEKWSPKRSRSSRLTSYMQEGETIEENKRTSNVREIKTHQN